MSPVTNQQLIQEKLRSELTLLGVEPEAQDAAMPGIMKRLERSGRRKDSITHASSILKISDDINALAEIFQHDDISKDALVRAALKHPDLFFADPNTVKENVAGMVTRFAAEGLTRHEYAQAALGHPQLFGQRPETLESNIRDFVKPFEVEGLTVSDYLHKAALNQPSLFSMSPDTTATHLRIIIDTYKKGLIKFSGKGYDPNAPEALKPILDYTLANPVLLKTATNTLILKTLYAATSGKDSPNAVLRATSSQVIGHLFAEGGHDDPRTPIPHIPEPPEDAKAEEVDKWARSRALRSLVRSGILPGSVEEPKDRSR